MFEDDIEVAPTYFDYILTSLKKYIFTDPKQKGRSKSYHAKHLYGIALTTPRYDETSVPRRQWTPDYAISSENYFLFQLACSWGALYFPWSWRLYLNYYTWRKQLNLPKKLDVIPHSFVNIWERSWKRYLQEVMFLQGGVMLYPSFQNQASFSTHHRELGEHTQGQSAVPFVDSLGTNNKPIFTVPLINDTLKVYESLRNLKRLEELPVVDFYHHKAVDLYQLAELGLVGAERLREFGYTLEMHSKKSARCILDYGLKVDFGRFSYRREKYLTFHPQGSLLHQIGQLRSALAMAHILKRVLLVPDFISDVNSTLLPVGDILDADRLVMKGYVQLRVLQNIRYSRLVAFQPFNIHGERQVDFKLPLLSNNTQRTVRLPIGPGTDYDVFRWFNGCSDETLVFVQSDNSFSQFVDLDENRQFRELFDTTVQWSANIKLILASVRQEIGEIACLNYYKPREEYCRKPKYDTRYWRSVHHRNCNATVEKTLKYAEAWMDHLKLNITSIYVVSEPGENIPISRMTKSGDLILVYHSQLLKKKLEAEFGISLDSSNDIVKVIEEELCTEATFYLGNMYSWRSQRIVEKRESKDLSKYTNVLGMGMLYPYRNETLPGFD